MNPFTYYPKPASPREHQSNANHYHYELMGAREDLAGFDTAKIPAPASVIADHHTLRWVAKEHERLARKAWAEARA